MKSILKDKKGQLISNTIQGIGGLVIATIIILVIVATMFQADLFKDARSTGSRLNQQVGPVNLTALSFGNDTLSDPICTVNRVVNVTDGVVIGAGNFSVVGCTIAFKVGGDQNFNGTNWDINSTTTFDGLEDVAVKDMRANFTQGIGNVSSKLPTILLIAAVVLLISILVLLFRNAEPIIGGSRNSI
jgi:hypothetical protein